MFLKLDESHIREELGLLIRNAGYPAPTLLQEKLIPLIVQGKDFLVETGNADGKTSSYLLPIIMALDLGRPGVQILVVTSSFQDSQKVEKQFRMFSPGNRRIPVAVLGSDDGPKKELSLLSQGPAMVIGHGPRIIDHIRRENLDVSQIDTLVLDLPRRSENSQYEKDADFILGKISRKCQRLVFTVDTSDAEALTLGKIPHLRLEDWREGPVNRWWFPFEDLEGHLRGEGKDSVLYIAQGDEDRKRLFRAAKSAKVNLTPVGNRKRENAQLNKRLRRGATLKLVVDRDDLAVSGLTNLDAAYFLSPPDDPADTRTAEFTFHESSAGARLGIFGSGEPTEDFKEFTMKKLDRNDPIADAIDDLVKAIRESERPDELDAYRKIVRKRVPFFLRGYFTALLVKRFLANGKSPRPPKGAARGTARGATKTLFFSVGKNRRVFPKDLIRVIGDTADVPGEKVGAIRVLDNYSFVEVDPSVAQRIVESCNGVEFRGRSMTVDFARKKG